MRVRAARPTRAPGFRMKEKTGAEAPVFSFKEALPAAARLDFDATTPDEVLAAIAALAPGDLVVLIQSMNFRLSEFRFRIELFQRGIAVIEHVHLERADDERQMAIYVDSLAYDREYYVGTGRRLKGAIDAARTIAVRCAGTELIYEGGRRTPS